MRVLALLSVLLWAAPAAAQETGPAQAADVAARQLEAAAQMLDAAQSARDRVRALTQTVRGYEAGLAAMREGLRRAATREAALSRRLEAQRGEVSRLLGTLQVIETAPPPLLILHPSGPLGAARSGIVPPPQLPDRVGTPAPTPRLQEAPTPLSPLPLRPLPLPPLPLLQQPPLPPLPLPPRQRRRLRPQKALLPRQRRRAKRSPRAA